jgi:hypothetical protein
VPISLCVVPCCASRRKRSLVTSYNERMGAEARDSGVGRMGSSSVSGSSSLLSTSRFVGGRSRQIGCGYEGHREGCADFV